MAGGRGTRFWPLSRAGRPKQLLALASEKSLLRETCERVFPLVGAERVLVVTGEDITGAVAAELPELSPSQIIGEPIGRNTAACAALGIGLAEQRYGPGPVALLPADHWIPDPQLFGQQLQAAFQLASSLRQAITFGIPPLRPETGYGYLEVDPSENQDHLAGLRFVEKPDLATAETYLTTGRHFWNSGIFIWHSQAFADALTKYLPVLATHLAPALAVADKPDFATALRIAYEACPAISIDVGIMEKLASFTVIKAAFTWSDLGSWDAWGSLAPAGDNENRGQAQMVTVDSKGNVVYAPAKTVALLGVDKLIVVDTPDALLVCPADQAQRIRELTAQLEAQNRHDLL
jgi:mannose-1-phosphate guanylyltransferase